MNYKGIVKLMAAILIGVILLYVLSLVFSPKYISENQEGRITAEFYRETTDLDVVFFGTSTSYCSIAPPYLWHRYGFTSYTRACDSETMWQTYYLLRDTVKYNKPDVVVCDMSGIKFGEEFVEEPANRKIMDGMRFSADKLKCARVSMHEDESLPSYVFPVFRFHSRWQELKDEDFLYAFHKPDVTHDGYLMSFDHTAEEGEGGPEEGDVKLPDKAKEYLVKIADYCEEQGITLMLIKTPTYINWYQSYDSEINEIAGRFGISYINFDYYKEDIGLVRSEDYIDGHSHLNIYGSEKFCDYMGAYIKEQTDIPDHREDEVYASVWDGKYDAYETGILSGQDKGFTTESY